MQQFTLNTLPSGSVTVQELLVSEISPGCWLPVFSMLGKTIMSLSRVG